MPLMVSGCSLLVTAMTMARGGGRNINIVARPRLDRKKSYSEYSSG